MTQGAIMKQKAKVAEFDCPAGYRYAQNHKEADYCADDVVCCVANYIEGTCDLSCYQRGCNLAGGKWLPESVFSSAGGFKNNPYHCEITKPLNCPPGYRDDIRPTGENGCSGVG